MARFPNEEKALEYFESIRWPNGVICPHCGNQEAKKLWKIQSNPEKKIRAGLRQCGVCKKQFRATVGTLFEKSHIPLHYWLVAWYLLCGAKKGISAKQVQRYLGIKTYQTAWFLCHRIRHAMRDPVFEGKLEGVVEVDETYVGGYQTAEDRKIKDNKTPVVSLVERGGKKRSMVMKRVTSKNLQEAVINHVHPTATVITDENNAYRYLHHAFDHRSVKHMAKEYARREQDMVVHSNTVESSFSLLKRGVIGNFHHVSEKHLPLYLAEFDFRWNSRKDTDGERTVEGLKRVTGKRLTWKPLIKS